MSLMITQLFELRYSANRNCSKEIEFENPCDLPAFFGLTLPKDVIASLVARAAMIEKSFNLMRRALDS
jgi:hypothetical protein